MGDLPPLIGNPYNGYRNPYYWVDDHPLLYGNNGSLDPSTYRHILHRSESRWRNPPKGGLVRGHDKPIHGSPSRLFFEYSLSKDYCLSKGLQSTIPANYLFKWSLTSQCEYNHSLLMLNSRCPRQAQFSSLK